MNASTKKRSGRARSAAVGALMLPILALLGGCRSCPLAERYFDLQTPYNTLNGFVYAVDAGQWDFAYTCVSSEDRETYDITPFEMEVGLNFIFKHPRWGIPLKRIILDAERSRAYEVAVSAEERKLHVFYAGTTDEGISIDLPIWIYLVRESIDGSPPLWRIRFEKTIRLSN